MNFLIVRMILHKMRLVAQIHYRMSTINLVDSYVWLKLTAAQPKVLFKGSSRKYTKMNLQPLLLFYKNLKLPALLRPDFHPLLSQQPTLLRQQSGQWCQDRCHPPSRLRLRAGSFSALSNDLRACIWFRYRK